MPEDVNDRLARIETKIDAFLISQNDQEERIRKLETRQSALFGGGGLLIGFLTVGLTFIQVGAS